ncbi:hypothetical protein [Streptomyces sp. NPDC001436]
MSTVPYLDWGDRRHFDPGPARPCCLCGICTPMRSHAGEAVHKVCAEEWNATHVDEARRYTPPAPGKPQHDAGTWRFHNDGPVTARLRATPAARSSPQPPTLPEAGGQDGLFAA